MISKADKKFIKDKIRGKLRIEAIRIMREFGFSCYEMAAILKKI